MKVPEPPTETAIEMKNRGYSDEKIKDELKDKGYNPQEVYEAINQLNIKRGVEDSQYYGMKSSILNQEEIPIPEPPEIETQTEMPQMQVANLYKRTTDEEVVETIVEEKWQRVNEIVGNVEAWKARVEDEITAIKQEILRISNRFDNLQQAILGKVEEYSKNISDVNVEVKALEKVLQNILQPLTLNIKELSRITKTIKK